MLLSDLLISAWRYHKQSNTRPYILHGYPPESIDILRVTDDSRDVQSGSLFFAIRGTNRDGHLHVDDAISRGARAIVLEERPTTLYPEVAYVIVEDSREAMGLMASAWFGHPSRDIQVVGVTGTNGKTTTATLLYNLFTNAGFKSGLISTVCNCIGEQCISSTHTTPGAIALQGLLYKMRDSGCTFVFMEVSSHAIDQKRISGLHFKGGVFTNLTRDHLDYHKTVLEYRNTKKRFFDNLPLDAFAITNLDDKSGMVMLQNSSAKKVTYSINGLAKHCGKIIEHHACGMDLQIDGEEVSVQLVGEFNAYNLLAVYSVAIALGLPKEETLRYLSLLKNVSGRMEIFHSQKKGYTAFVDYAHTPDALKNVLETLQKLRRATGNKSNTTSIITVIGCGGERDKGKRPLMTREAILLSSRVILTSDNPRSEQPEDIIRDMKEGLEVEALSSCLTITDRAEAIRTACLLAQEGDYILVAGKGHESYQEIMGVKYPFDDREVLRAIIQEENLYR